MNRLKNMTTLNGPAGDSAMASAAARQEPAPAFKVDVRRSVRMHPWAAAGAFAVVLAMMLGVGLTRKPVYEAESLTYIEPLASKVLSDGSSGTYDPSRYDSYLQQQMQTAQRPDILAAALARLPVGVWQQPGESTQSAVARLQSALKIERVTTSYQISISLTGPNPRNVAAVVNAVTEAYLEQGRKDEHSSANGRLALLTAERQRLDAQLAQDRREQAALGASLGVADPVGAEADPYDLQLAGMRTELTGAEESKAVAAAQLAALEGAQGTGSAALNAAADEQIASDPGLSSMRSTINERRAVLNGQMAGLTPSNPVYKQDENEIADLDRSVDAMTVQLRDRAARRLEDKSRADLARAEDVEARLKVQLAQQTATATGAVSRMQRADELTADMARLTARYGVVDDAIRGLELESSGPGLAHLSVAASVPLSPEPSRQKLILLAAFPLALLAGILIAVLALKRDRRLYLPADAAEVLGFPPMGVLPAEDEVSPRVLEEYRLRLAAALEAAYRVGAARVYVFSAAAQAGEPAREFVQSTRRTLRQLGLSAHAVGAADLMSVRTDVSGVREAGAESVALAPGGHEGFARRELERFKQEFDLVLIEAAPLLGSAETEYLVRCADATILLVQAGVTTRDELYRSAALLERLHAPGAGVVVDGVRLEYADRAFREAVAAAETRSPERSRSAAARAAAAEETTGSETIAAAVGKAPLAVVDVPAAQSEPAVGRVDDPVAPAVLRLAEQAARVAAKEPIPAAQPMANAPEAAVPERTSPVPVAEEPFVLAPPERGRKLEAVPEVLPMAKTGWWSRMFGASGDPITGIAPHDDGEEDEESRDQSAAASKGPELARMEPMAAASEDGNVPVVEAPGEEAATSGPEPAVRTEAAALGKQADGPRNAAQSGTLDSAAALEPVQAPVVKPRASALESRDVLRPLSFVELAKARVMHEQELRAAPVAVDDQAAPVESLRVEPAAAMQKARPVEARSPLPVRESAASEVVAASAAPAKVPAPAAGPVAVPAGTPARSSDSSRYATARWEPGRRVAPASSAPVAAAASGPASSGAAAERVARTLPQGLAKLEAARAQSIPATAWVPRAAAPEKPAEPGHGLSRRWAMLSRFNQGAPAAEEETVPGDGTRGVSRPGYRE